MCDLAEATSNQLTKSQHEVLGWAAARIYPRAYEAKGSFSSTTYFPPKVLQSASQGEKMGAMLKRDSTSGRKRYEAETCHPAVVAGRGLW